MDSPKPGGKEAWKGRNDNIFPKGRGLFALSWFRGKMRFVVGVLFLFLCLLALWKAEGAGESSASSGCDGL